jgi:hypothetical protein
MVCMARKKPAKSRTAPRLEKQSVDVPAAEYAVFKAIVLMAISAGTVAERLCLAFDRHLAELRLYALPPSVEKRRRSIARRMTSAKMHEMHVKDGVSRAWVTTRRMHWRTAHRIAQDVVELHSQLEYECDRLE